MKIGFIVECGPMGAETKVIPYLAGLVRPGIKTDVIPLDRKPVLKEHCGRYAAELLSRGCDRVLIVWDLLPDWGEYEGFGCLHDDREEIYQSLRYAGIEPMDERIQLVCIHKMLEAWLLADERALSEFLSTAAHRIPVARRKSTESVRDPKAALDTLFRTSRSPLNQYIDREHAIKIAKLMPDLNRVNRLVTFTRFRDRLLR